MSDATRTDDLRSYTGTALDIHYDKQRCIHAAECGRGLKAVFDGSKTPWIDPELAPVEKIVDVVHRCPTGAVTYTRKDGGPEEPVSSRNVVQVSPSGPLFVRGDITIKRDDGSETREKRVALCRCGASKIKPFCDDSHVAAGFRDAGPVNSEPKGEMPGAGTLSVQVLKDGPLVCTGPLTVRTASGRDAVYATRVSLCRCGQSSNRPFCDGTHKKVGFSGA